MRVGYVIANEWLTVCRAAGLGDKDTALTWLERAFDKRSHWLVWLRLDPRWRDLHSDARFVELVRRMEFPR